MRLDHLLSKETWDLNKVSYPKVNQSEHECRSLFNLEGAIERLCTFKRGKEKIKILMSLNYLGV